MFQFLKDLNERQLNSKIEKTKTKFTELACGIHTLLTIGFFVEIKMNKS